MDPNYLTIEIVNTVLILYVCGKCFRMATLLYSLYNGKHLIYARFYAYFPVHHQKLLIPIIFEKWSHRRREIVVEVKGMRKETNALKHKQQQN